MLPFSPVMHSYANSRHPYGFPRILAMMGDGQTSYDQAHDGDANSLGSCQANFRRTNVITKLKITYVRDTYLDVRLDPCVITTTFTCNCNIGQGSLPSLCVSHILNRKLKLTSIQGMTGQIVSASPTSACLLLHT
jgi:hypothetical protein